MTITSATTMAAIGLTEVLGDFFPLLIVAAVIAVVVLGWYRQKRRREAIQALCRDNGWHYQPRNDRWARGMRDFFPLFRKGFGRRCTNVVTIPNEPAQTTLFDYQYKERSGSGKNRSTTTYRYKIALSRMPTPLPELRIDSENMLTRLAGSFGFAGLETESEEFNNRFRVNAEDRRTAFAVLNPRMIEFLTDQELENWEIVGDWLLVASRGRWKLEDYAPVAETTAAFVGHVPDWVWRDHDPNAPADAPAADDHGEQGAR